MRLRWTERAANQLLDLAERAPAQASNVIEAMEWMAKAGFSLGRSAHPTFPHVRYWPVPPQGVLYRVDDDVLIVIAVVDARRRREPGIG